MPELESDPKYKKDIRIEWFVLVTCHLIHSTKKTLPPAVAIRLSK